ncbi:MAG: class I SAM-dependent methyltransferase [Candidatus Dormibacteria bacterium]|jgi:caffeoyl-CoA O-methyltransferase
MAHASAFLDSRISAYLAAHAKLSDPLLAELVEETHQTYPELDMQISPDEGALLRLLVRLCGAGRAIEVGTFTGYSSLCIARGLPPKGRLLCCDVNEEWTSMARRYWERAGLADRIELRLAPALETIAQLPLGQLFDFAFIDAEKSEYIAYYEALVPRMAPGGLIAVDNVLRHGWVAGIAEPDERTHVIREFNEHVLVDTRTESVIVPIADGLTLITAADPEGRSRD